MSNDKTLVQQTQHAFLIAWGHFAQQIGLVSGVSAVELKQKKYVHTPQTKALEFVVATLAGCRYLQDISLAAHPLDKDAAAATAWNQPGWADYTGVSRTLRGLSWPEVHALVAVLVQVSQPFIQTELQLLRSQDQRVQLDGDLTGLPVFNTSQTYPNAAFGHMDDEIRLGYQAAVVSLVSPTYRRLWLSVAHHPGDTVSCTQAEALVRAAEARLGLRPVRRTDLLQQRIATFQAQMTPVQKRLQTQQQAVATAHVRLTEAQQQAADCQRELADLEHAYQSQQRLARPTSRLVQARNRVQAAANRCLRRQTAWQQAQQRVAKTTTQLAALEGELRRLQERLARFMQDNAANPQAVAVEFRLDAGFGTYENVALLIELGSEVYTKAYSYQVVCALKRRITEQMTWTRVGANAEMVAWASLTLPHGAYPLDVALERFYTGQTVKHAALLHFGADPVTQDLPAWFAHYNGRQLIEAGIKEGKQVFYLHRIKVRAEPAIYLQECCVLFAANFIRWAQHWLAKQNAPAADVLDVQKLGVKRQVQVAAHVSAQVSRDSEGWLLTFSEHSVFAGKVLRLSAGSTSPS
jgi:hypothetical protein